MKGLHDRYSVARTNVGFPPVVAIVSSIQLSDETASIDDKIQRTRVILSGRIKKLLEFVPLLSAKVIDSKTREPKWCKSDREVNPEGILKINHLEGANTLEKVLKNQLDLGMETLRPDLEPMWRVDLHYSSTEKEVFIGLAVNHTLADGKGCFNLFRLLFVSPNFNLSNDLTESQITSIRGAKSIPEASDVAFNMKPGWSVFLRTIYKSLIIPSLPSFLRIRLEGLPHWPYKLEARIQECKPALFLLQFEEKGFMNDLKEASKRFGLKTIHSVINSTIIVGILALALDQDSNIIGDGSRPAGFPKDQKDQNIVIKADTPINVRKEEHGLVAGNFVSGFEWDKGWNGESSFWDITRSYDRALNSDESRRCALSYIGMLDYVSSTFVALERRCRWQQC